MINGLVKVIIDYDGTLTYEERYVVGLAKKAIKDLAENILHISAERLTKIYQQTKQKILQTPEKYSWVISGIPACYAVEGALLLNTVTTQTLLNENRKFKKAIEKFFLDYEYDPVVDCTNYLFHKHTFDLKPRFRKKAKEVLIHFIEQEGVKPYILSCSKGDKIAKNFARLGIGTDLKHNGFKYQVNVFGDTRQYEMDPEWNFHFDHPKFGRIQQIAINDKFSIDLRRSVYFDKLKQEAKDGSKIIITADMVSLPGILPLLMGMEFVLLKASYTPQWAVDFVNSWKNGWVIDNIGKLPKLVDKIMEGWFLKNKL